MTNDINIIITTKHDHNNHRHDHRHDYRHDNRYNTKDMTIHMNLGHSKYEC